MRCVCAVCARNREEMRMTEEKKVKGRYVGDESRQKWDWWVKCEKEKKENDDIIQAHACTE